MPTENVTIAHLRDAFIAYCELFDPETPVIVANKAYGGRNDYRADGPGLYRSCTFPMVLAGLTDANGKPVDFAVLLPH